MPILVGVIMVLLNTTPAELGLMTCSRRVSRAAMVLGARWVEMVVAGPAGFDHELFAAALRES